MSDARSNANAYASALLNRCERNARVLCTDGRNGRTYERIGQLGINPSPNASHANKPDSIITKETA